MRSDKLIRRLYLMLGTLLPLHLMAAATSPAYSESLAAGGRHPLETAVEKNMDPQTDETAVRTALSDGPAIHGINGLGRLYRSGENWLWEIPDSLLGRRMSLFITLLDAPVQKDRDAKYGYAGDRFGPMLLRLTDAGSMIRLEQAVGMAFANESTAAARLHNEARTWNTHSWLPVIRRNGESVTIDAGGMLADDQLFGLQGVSFMLKLGMCIDRKPALQEIRQIPGGLIVRSERTYTSIPFPGRKIDTTRWRIGASLSLLPREAMPARYFDPRVGYFKIPGYRTSEDASELMTANIVTRWHLEPAACDTARYNRGEKVVPQQKIVFYFDPEFPEQWKPATRRAAANWNPIFEAAGFRNAIEVRDADANDPTCTPDNGRLSWIRFTPSPNENAYGRSYTDLRNGEVLCALIQIFEGSFNLERRWHIGQTGSAWPMDKALEEQIFESVLTHEIGHVLGLEHNFYGSTRYDTNQLRDAGLMHLQSTSTSIMDYVRLNHAAQPEDGFEAKDLVPRVGPYDRAAIEWGYRSFLGCDEAAIEDSLACRAAGMFASREQRYMPQGNTRDPQVMAEDIGRHPLETIELGMHHLQRAAESLRDPQPGMVDTALIRQSIERQMRNYIGQAFQHIGGRRRVFDRPEELYRAVGADEQRKALAFLKQYVIEAPEWFDPTFAADQRSGLAGSLIDRLPLIEENRLAGSDYPIEAYLADLGRLFAGECDTTEPSPQRLPLIESYTEALAAFAQAPTNEIMLRIKCLQTLESLREQIAAWQDPCWTELGKRIASRLETDSKDSKE